MAKTNTADVDSSATDTLTSAPAETVVTEAVSAPADTVTASAELSALITAAPVFQNNYQVAADACVDDWVAQRMRNSPTSQFTPAWNHFIAEVDDLKSRLKALLA